MFDSSSKFDEKARAPVYCGSPSGHVPQFIAELERNIETAGLTLQSVLRAAGVDSRHLSKVRLGRRRLTPLLERRISHAIAELKREAALEAREKASDKTRPWESKAGAQYRMAVIYVARASDVSPGFILNSDPSLKATADPDWLRAARLRRIALYIANQYLHVPQADLARAAGMGRAAVCRGVQEIEDLREQADISAILSALEEGFS